MPVKKPHSRKKVDTDKQTVETVTQDQFITISDLKAALSVFGTDLKAQMNSQIQDIAGVSTQDGIKRIVEAQMEEVFGGEQFRSGAYPAATMWDLNRKRLVARELDHYSSYTGALEADKAHLAEMKADRLGRAQDSWAMARTAFYTKLLDANDASEAKKTLALIGSYVGVENAFDTDLEALVNKAVGDALKKRNK